MAVGPWRGVRPLDVLVTGVLSGLASLLVAGNVSSDDWGIRIDSRSWWMLPVFLLAVVPVLWWRRAPVAVAATSAAAMTAHDLIFGHLVRCGAGLPLVFVLAFVSGLVRGSRRGPAALGLTAVNAAAVLVYDTAAGIELLPGVLLIMGLMFGLGRVARSRSVLAEQLGRRTEELRVLRDERAALEVQDDRVHVSRQLETVLDERLARLEAAAGEGAADPDRARDLLVAIEEDSREALGDMREVVGVLRGGEATLAPTPSVAQLDALLARLGRARLAISGDPRVLPASLELSAYRIVEHLLPVLADTQGSPVDVRVRFTPQSLDLTVTGSVLRGADLRQAAARARERARLHAGSLDLRVTRGQARVEARLPVPVG